MKQKDWRKVAFRSGVLLESVEEAGRLVFWLPRERDGRFQYWERIGTLPAAEIRSKEEHDLCAAPARMIRARQHVPGPLAKILWPFRKASQGHVWHLPDGATAEQIGDGQSDLLLVWREAGTLEEGQIKSCWPKCKEVERIGERLFLVCGVQDERGEAVGAAHLQNSGARPVERPGLLLRRGELAALIDIGLVVLREGDAAAAARRFEEALVLAQRDGDRLAEADARASLGLAALALAQPERADQLFVQELDYARTAQDPLAEKVALEHRGLACSDLGDKSGALSFFEQALALATRLGDRQHQAKLLWHTAIQHAELGNRDLAIGAAQQTVDLLQTMSDPHAAVLRDYLQKYSAGESGAGLGGSAVEPAAKATAGQVTATPQQAAGPGLLRMALSAAKAMGKLLGSGFKMAPPETRQQRLDTCARCDHYTGRRCRVCGCFTDVKSRLSHETCPIGKWPV